MRNGRIVLLSDYIGGEGPGSGGAGHAALDSYRALRAAGADVHAIAGFGERPEVEPERFHGLGGADLRGAGTGAMLRAIYNPDAQAAVSRELAGLDTDTTLIVLHQWTRYLSPAALRIASRFPTMIYMHDYFWVCPNGIYYDFTAGKPCDRRPMRRHCLTSDCDRQGRLPKLGRLARHAVRHATTASRPSRRLFLHLSEHAQRTIMPLLPDQRHAVLHNPLSLPEAEPQPAPPPSYDIGYFGRLEADKGVGLLVEALRETGRTGLFVGQGSLEPLLAATPGITHRPWAPREAMAAAMRSCGVVVLPSLWNETWGLIVPEAMAAGVPVLVSSRAGSSELVGRFGGGHIFDPGQPGSLATMLAQMAAEPPSPTRQHAALRRFLSPERHAARILGLAESHFGLTMRDGDQPVRASAPWSISRPA
ncbi:MULTISPECIES: glycosyltransferase [Sphingomonas]|jgi:glycosyltransferase involved in cell wall biosynthesis|uniref:Glycosyltransferase n=1 Tax=Sphingomonas zeae TaxID=1646122 RepID=A0A7Y6B6I6_9SPHN|nr:MULTISPECIES: glycosyltransferase [Sphingomonas]MBB4048643.1 glycosyltransferase involved in cell wall biosynthesis [Sphingomonas zeae]MDK8186463.1 glycosyltransferase [Sphingomonas zeae]MDK8216122.1 glycosyltransferase [Sphingomonas sp. UMB7805-LC452B]NUU47925.1 glycosyltransferase [Sphingomonas zeae]